MIPDISENNSIEEINSSSASEGSDVAPMNSDTSINHKEYAEQSTINLKAAFKEINGYKDLLKAKNSEEKRLEKDLKHWKETTDCLKIENDVLKTKIRKIEVLNTEIMAIKKANKKLEDDFKKNNDIVLQDIDNYKTKTDFAIESIKNFIKESLENKDTIRDQKIDALERNVSILEHSKAKESEKNKKLEEENEKLQKIIDDKDQQILELNQRNAEDLAMLERLRVDFNKLFAEHSKSKENLTLSCKYLFQGITNSFDKQKINSFYQTPIGFPNIGQTCYLNSLLHPLIYTPDFIRLTYLSENSLLLSISKIADNIQNADDLNSWYRSFYLELMKIFPNIKANREQDAKEVLLMILSQINEANQKRLFNIVVNKNYECSEGHLYSKTDTSFFVIVPYNSNIENTLQGLYDKQLFDEIWCQECESLMKHTLHVSSVEFPLYLIAYMPKSKDNARRTNFNYPRVFKIFDYSYSLYAIICHRQSYISGHYLAYVFIHGVWYECDDSRIKKQNPDYKAAYLLFYQKNK